MGIARVDQIEPGMVIASDVIDRSGRVLLATGTVLTDKHLRVFRMWGITEADIQGLSSSGPDGDAENDPEDQIREEAIACVGELFARANQGHAAIAELMRLSVAWHERMLRAKKGHGTEAA